MDRRARLALRSFMERKFKYNCLAERNVLNGTNNITYKYKIEFESRECISADDFDMAIDNLEFEAENVRKGYD